MIEENRHKRDLRDSIDWKLIIVYLILVLIGWVNIYAAVHTSEPGAIYEWGVRSGKQLIWMLTAFSLAALILFVIPPKLWEVSSIPLYGFVFVLLIAVIFLSKDVNGSHSWFELGPVKFQPAEISKITTSLLLAAYMSRPNFRLGKLKDFIVTLAIIGLPMLSIVAESETGSALVYTGFIFVLYREGLSGWWLAFIGMAILLFITTLTLSPYSSIIILAAILSVCAVVKSPRKESRKRLLIGGSFVGVMALLPSLWRTAVKAVERRQAFLESRYYVPQAGETDSFWWDFFPTFDPVWILVGLIAAALPFLVYHAYRHRDRFLGMSIVALVSGMIMVFSTEYIFNNILKDYQRGRIEVLLGIKEDLAGAGYNVNQSKIAIGSGGLFGKGYLQGTQTTLGFVPEQATDFIFCTVGEEWGFVGCLVIILLYVFLISRLIIDAERCRSPFTRIYGYCVAACIFMHLFINIGMTVGLMPVIGIPLPLLSYGGSSLWAFTILIFIFIALYRDEKKYF